MHLEVSYTYWDHVVQPYLKININFSYVYLSKVCHDKVAWHVVLK